MQQQTETYTIWTLNEIYQQFTGTRVQELGNDGLCDRKTMQEMSQVQRQNLKYTTNAVRTELSNLERDLQILRLIRTNLVVDVLGGHSRKGLREPAGVTYHHARKNCYKKSVNQHARLIAFMPAFLFLFILVKQTH